MQQVIDESKYYTPNLSDFDIDMSSRAYWTTIPAGSTDALQDAIDNADPGGIIYLKSGMHRETQRVTVNKRVAIIGEDGAVLMLESIDNDAASFNPGLYVVNVPRTVIQNIEIEPLNTGAATCVLFESSEKSAMLNCKITGFSVGIMIEKSDKMAIIDNEIKNGGFFGLLVVNGSSCYIADNDVSEFGMGMWACDKWGTLLRNDFHDNGLGTLLCNYPEEYEFTVPSSPNYVGAIYTCIGWKLSENKFRDNLDDGLAIRDGAHWNLIESSNEFSGNGGKDIVIPADEDVPGFIFIPAAYKNIIRAAPNVLIKDCGINNTIIGGTMVDTSVDPC